MSTLRWSDYLNAAATLVLIAFIAIQGYYLPLFSVAERAKLGKRPVFKYDEYVTLYRAEFILSFLFWSVLYLVKFSFLMLYRSIFAVSKTFRVAWWGVFAFTALVFPVHLLDSLWMCGDPSGLFNPGATKSPSYSWIIESANEQLQERADRLLPKPV